MNLAYICSIGVGPILSTWPRGHRRLKQTQCVFISMAQCKKDATPLLTHWSQVPPAPSHRYELGILNRSQYFIYCSRDHGHSQPNTLVGCGSMSGWSLCIDLQPLVIHRANDGPCWQTRVYSNVTHPHTAHRATVTVTCTKWRWLSARLQQLHC